MNGRATAARLCRLSEHPFTPGYFRGSFPHEGSMLPFPNVGRARSSGSGRGGVRVAILRASLDRSDGPLGSNNSPLHDRTTGGLGQDDRVLRRAWRELGHHAVTVMVAVAVANLAEWNHMIEVLVAGVVIVIMILGTRFGARRWPTLLADPRDQQLDRIEKAINELTRRLRGRQP